MGAGRVLPRNLLSAEGTAASGWRSAVHPEDVERHMDKTGVSVANGEPLEDEARFRRNAAAAVEF
jgi:PAS fold